MARRRKQKKQQKPALNLRAFEATEASEALAATEAAAGLPAFFLNSIVGVYGADAAGDLVQGIHDAAKRPVTFRVNTMKATREAVQKTLEQRGIPSGTVTWYGDAFVVSADHEHAIWDLDLIKEGAIYLQSLSSMLPPLALDVQPSEDVLDMCAAPGGKTTELAALAPRAHVTACEMHAPRADKLEHNLAKQGATNVQVMRCDARELDEFFSFDRILLDAPCTGSGTLIAGNERTFKGFSEQLLEKCARSQRALLDRALTVLKPGGTLVYSTCSVLPQENEDAVQGALKKHRDCRLVSLDGTVFEDDDGNDIPLEHDPVTDAIAAGELPMLANDLPGTVTLGITESYEGFYLAKIRKDAR